MEPIVSVIVPTYNRANYLGEALDSILGQTFADYEAIVVDDGSTDRTAELVRSVSDPRIRYVYQENQGVSSARNRGIREARGSYVAFLDSDDLWLPELLETATKVLVSDSTIGLVYARAQAFHSTGDPLPYTSGAPPRFADDLLNSALWGDFVCTITTVVRREILDWVGPFDETMKGNEDWDMWIRLSRVTGFRFVDRVLALFRVHSGRMTLSASEHFETITEGRFQPLNKVFDDPGASEHILSLKPLAYRNAHIDVACRWMTAGKVSKGLTHIRKAIAVGPSPIATLARVAQSILFSQVLVKHTWGFQLLQKGAAARRKLHWLARRS